MGTRLLLGLVGMVVASTVVGACSASTDEAVGGDRASVTQATFDKNAVLTDTALRDSTAMSSAEIQSFLEKTPWGHASVLATYEENGKSAAEIMHDAAEKNGINPLELLVRVQMEQSLVYKTTASDETISIAFGCGCPHSPVCSSKYEGFANQADCAAGTLARSMDRALTSDGTASGWKKGEEKLTQDKVEIVPKNAATAALYTYTPWVGEAGGGKKGVGGASLHYQVWGRFADAVGYGGAGANAANAGNANADTSRDVVLDAGPASNPPRNDPPPGNAGQDGNNGDDTPPGNAGQDGNNGHDTDAGAPATDHGAERDAGSSTADAGTKKGDTKQGTPQGEDDDDILSEGNAPPSNSAPLPKSSGSRGKSASGGEKEATEEELAGKKKASSGGCSSTGARGGADAALAGIVMAAASLVASRRRRRA